MKTLVINTGSSSIKYQLLDMPTGQLLCSGLIERVGEPMGMVTHKNYTSTEVSIYKAEKNIADHKSGMDIIAVLLVDKKYGVISKPEEVLLVGHRVVHGGESFTDPTHITKPVIKKLEEISGLAPLHNPPNITGIKVAMQVFSNAKQVAIFDTAFHQTMPSYAYRYAIPNDLYNEHGLRVYGFHGTSHKYISTQAAIFLGKELSQLNLISIHLGNGCSITAIKNGKSIDTSLGLTPLPGLVMGTRSGDIDPALIFYLSESLGWPIDKIKSILNKESGLKGLTGENDLRAISKKYDEGDELAILALSIYSYRIKKYIGSYIAAIGQTDAIVFTAGVGENSSLVRELSTDGLSHMGIELDQTKNNETSTAARDISKDNSKIKILVIPTNEELEIAKQAYAIK